MPVRRKPGLHILISSARSRSSAPLAITAAPERCQSQRSVGGEALGSALAFSIPGGRRKVASPTYPIHTRRAHHSSGLSFAQGPSSPPLLTSTIPCQFSAIVSQYGDRPAVIARRPRPLDSSSSPPPPPSTQHRQKNQDHVLTFHALDGLSNRLAHSLRSIGVRKGDPVAVSLGNTAHAAALSYACFKLGAVLAPLNPGFKAAQVQAALNHLKTRVLVIGAVTDLPYKPCRGRSNEGLLRALVPDLETGKGVASNTVPSLEHVVVVNNLDDHPGAAARFPLQKYKALTPFSALREGSLGTVTPDSPLDPRETINIQFTSGTASQPKAAMLTHANILNNGMLIAHRMGLAPDDRVVVPPPLFHCFGSVLGYMATATTGAAILLPSPAFDPVATMRMVADSDATGLYGVTTMLVAYLEALEGNLVPRPPAGLRKGIVAGSSVPESLMRRAYARLGLRDLVICYGMTETSPVSCMTAPSDPLGRRCGTVGRAMPHTAVKIVDPHDRSRILPVGTPGELAAGGYLVMRGYLADEARTCQATSVEGDRESPEGRRTWMYSGDEAVMDEDGYVCITGRIKDLIVRGGENIHPLEVENCVFQHPAVADVSVVGVPDARLGEAVGAFVIRKRGEGVDAHEEEAASLGEDVREWVRERMSAHLVPKHVFWVDEFPKTASGKVQKYKLREMARGLVG